MKDYSAVYELLRKSHTVQAKPRLVAEFNHNRYSEPTATNTPLPNDTDSDVDIFDINSIVDGRRPGSGINKARVGQAKATEDYDISPNVRRYYSSSADDTYKYWTSPQPCSVTATPKFTNLITNPSFETPAATTQVQRFRNLCVNPLPFLAVGFGWVNGASGLYDLAQKGLITRVPSGGIRDAGINLQGAMGSVTAGTYTYSAEVKALIDTSVKLSVQSAIGGASTSVVELTAGEVKRVSITVSHTGSGTPSVYVLRGTTAASQFVVRKMMKTRTPFEVPYFDGSTPDSSLSSPFGLGYSYSWALFPNYSESICTGPTTGVEVIRNLAVYPKTYQGGTGTSPGFGARYVAQGTSATVSNASDGPLSSIASYARRTSTVDSSTNGRGFDLFGNSDTNSTNVLTGVPGETISWGVWIRSSSALPRTARMRWSGHLADGTRSGGGVGPEVTLAPNVWSRITCTATIPANCIGITSFGGLSDEAGATMVAGETVDMTGLIITRTQAVLDYFDGDIVSGYWNDIDFSAIWSGTVSASTSAIRAVMAHGASPSTDGKSIKSLRGASSGISSCRLITSSAGSNKDSYVDVLATLGGGFSTIVEGKTYTAMARSYQTGPIINANGGNNARGLWFVTTGGSQGVSVKSTAGPNVAGYADHKITFTIPVGSGVTYKSLRVINGGDPFGGDIYWDNIVLVEGDYSGSYFNGDSPETSVAKYAWSGTPHSSTSVYSELTNRFPSGTTYPTDVNPQVTYANLVDANKIVIGLEDSIDTPNKWSIYTQSTVGGTWSKIKDMPTDTLTINEDGQIVLYWNGSSWTQTKTLEGTTKLAGIQVRVESMTHPNTFFDLIELGARLEKDLTSYLVSASDSFDLSDDDTLSPVGKISSNTASITLFNHWSSTGFIFNKENTDSIFSTLMEENVKFTMDYIYKTPSGDVPVRQFEMYSTGSWSAGSLKDTTISLRDSSKFLQETKCMAMYYENHTVTGIAYRLLDSVGFDRYDIGKMGKQLIAGSWVDIPVEKQGISVPVFWASPDDTVWDTLQALCEGTQTVAFFDAFDKLQIRTRNQAFASLDGNVWTARDTKFGNELPDILEYQINQVDVSNDINVDYQTTAFEEYESGIRRNTIVWQPEDDTVFVKCSNIVADCLKTSTTINFTVANAALWPFESMILLDAEFIKYKGKEYTYYPSESLVQATVLASKKTVWLNSYEDYRKYHFELTPVSNRYLNKFSGRLKIEERGVWNSPIQDHKIETGANWTQKNVRGATAYADANGYFKSPALLAQYKAKYTTAKGLKATSILQIGMKAKKVASAKAEYEAYKELYNKYKSAAVTDGIDVPAEKGSLIFKTNANYIGNHYLMAVRGSATGDLGYKYYGTSVRFNKDTFTNERGAGIMFQSNGSAAEAGYFAEICMTGGTGGVGRVMLYRRDSAGTIIHIKSVDRIILEGKYYGLDVSVTGDDSSSTYLINVYVDGGLVISHQVTGANKLPFYGRFGLFARGKTNCNFEYIYAVSPYGGDTGWPDNFAKYDRIGKGFMSARFSDYATGKVEKSVKRKKNGKTVTIDSRYTRFFFDEFGPLAHEVRKFDVKYDASNDLPVLAPYVYHTNTSNVDLLDVVASAYGATIYMVNTSRGDAALQGTDDNHQFMVYGLLLKQKDSQSINVKNLKSISSIGTKSLSFQSQWVQSKESAQEIADWISGHWMTATDTIDVTIFGNTLIEVGDTISLDIQEAEINAEDNKYFVLSAESEFSLGGIGTTLKLRRAN